MTPEQIEQLKVFIKRDRETALIWDAWTAQANVDFQRDCYRQMAFHSAEKARISQLLVDSFETP